MSDLPIILPARIERGVLSLNRERMKQQIQIARDGEYTLTLERKHATRSLAQNALYWGIYVKTLSDYTGYAPEEIHELLKAKFLPKRIELVDANGEVSEITIGGSTTRLNKLQFTEYLERVFIFACELGVSIPEPNTVAA
jgi:hypothetical protein